MIGAKVDSHQVILLRLLSATTERGRVIANNIANQNTPGFTRKTVQFEQQLEQALQRPDGDPLKVLPKVVEDTTSPRRHDGNNVNAELEANAGSENRLLFETYAAILQGHLQMLDTAITNGR